MIAQTAESTAPLLLSAEELVRAQALLDEFQKNHPRYAHLELLKSYPDEDYMLAAKACRLFDVEVVLYEPIDTLHGVTEGSCVFLSGYKNGVSGHRPLWTAGHEASHVLGLRRRAEHAEFVSYIMRDCILPDAFDRRSTIEEMAQGYLRMTHREPVPEGWGDVVNEEIIADIAGNFWQDPAFWTGIHERDGNIARRALYTEIIGKLKSKPLRPYRSWVLDASAAREKYVEYMLLCLAPEVERPQSC
ncbi:hypothetical protein [Massilia oculi]|uniref:hypothetical protein n=1 Tax=Massilia oculi TaxID=945844 RepID=UPI0028AACB60|nr:hypothetical protein [Massilia oculi]